ncbi:LysR family transcriptional regulator [Kaarinaea lacus]
MQPMNWDDVQHFLEVVKSGSVSKASQRLGVNQTTVSRRISALECYLGKKLFERLANGWIITPVGEQLVAAAENMSEEAHTIERLVEADKQELSGKLRITVGGVLTQDLAMPVVQSFVEKYPDVNIEIIATRDELNLAAREADIALRTTDMPPANLVGKRVAQIGYAIYGTKQILAKVRSNAFHDDVPCITWIGDGVTKAPWIEKNFPKTHRIYRTNELDIMIRMARQGMGIAQIPRLFGDRASLLRRYPARFVEPGWGLWVLTHVDVRTTARVRIFRDLLVEALTKRINEIEGH